MLKVAARREVGVRLRRLNLDGTSLNLISSLELDRLKAGVEIKEGDEWSQLWWESEIDYLEMPAAVNSLQRTCT